MTKEKVAILTIENVAIWSGVGLALNIALPLIQLIAGLCAAIYSILSIIKMIKHWDEATKK